MNAELGWFGGEGGAGGVPRGLPVWPHCETLNGAKAALQTEIQFGGAYADSHDLRTFKNHQRHPFV